MTLVLMLFMQFFFPGHQYIHEPVVYAGVVIVLLGIAMAAVSAEMFKRAGTAIVPFDEATTLVTTGFYRYSRNPMYLGMFLVLTGVAVLMGSVGAAIPVFVFVLLIRNHFVLAEERFLYARFGRSYMDYKAVVRRWL